MFKTLLLLAGLIVVMTGLSVVQDGAAITGAMIAGSPIALVVLAPMAHAALAWHDGRPKRPPRAVIVRRRAS